MHYFSLHNQSGEHLGFFIMLADDESAAQPESGRFALKLQSETPPRDQSALPLLRELEASGSLLAWRTEKDKINLFADETPVGTLRNEYLTLSGHTLVLNDLTGMM